MAKKTIARLKLNSDKFLEDRSYWLKYYCLGKTDFDFLRNSAPFIAYELERQGLIEKIKDMMYYQLEEWE